MSMPIEEELSQTNLEVLSNFLIKFREAKQEENLSNYVIRYNGARNGNTGNISFYFSNTYTESNEYYELENIWSCSFPLNETKDNQTNAITWANFDYQAKINECTQGGGYALIKDRSQATTGGKRTASNFYQDNYLDYLHYNTLEVQPSPSQSPEPEEPSGDTTGNTTFLILISAILMLIVMYRFIGSLFSRGD